MVLTIRVYLFLLVDSFTIDFTIDANCVCFKHLVLSDTFFFYCRCRENESEFIVNVYDGCALMFIRTHTHIRKYTRAHSEKKNAEKNHRIAIIYTSHTYSYAFVHTSIHTHTRSRNNKYTSLTHNNNNNNNNNIHGSSSSNNTVTAAAAKSEKPTAAILEMNWMKGKKTTFTHLFFAFIFLVLIHCF